MVKENIRKSLLKGNSGVIIRHAERYSIENMINAFAAEITEKGLNDSLELGREIGTLEGFNGISDLVLYHSPIKRCIQTAERIWEGIGESKNNSRVAGVLHELGGPYITGEWQEVVNEIEKRGYEDFIRHWFSNAYPHDLLLPLKESAYTIIGAILDRLSGNSIMTINVTHDLNVLVLREYFFKIRHEELGLPGFLDGLVISVEGENLNLFYNDLEVRVGLPL